MASLFSINLVNDIIDEIALEGLDGITLEGLWKRLAQRLHKPLPLPVALTTQIWSVCVKINGFSFYELPVQRDPLVIFDRYEFVDPDLGIILEPDDTPEDIYPHWPINDVAVGIKGSCSTYHLRKDISVSVRTLSLEKVLEKYDRRLIIVASQTMRDRALMGVDICPTLELTIMQYCFLERVGRSRYHGEVTQGKLSLNALKEDPRSLFYHRKFLLRHKLITKQLHHQKTGGHSCSGSLLHLPRFYVERKPKIIYLAEQVVNILKSKPDCIAEYDEIKRKLQMENSIKKLYKTAFFLKIVRTDVRLPYRTLYPNALPSEWQMKNYPTKERTIRVVQLLEPDTDVAEAWNKDEIPDDDDPQELDISPHKFNVPYLRQANSLIEAANSEGVCQVDLVKKMGLTKLYSRTILRNMVRANLVATYMDDVGRQRITKFVSKRFEKSSKMSKALAEEMNKIQELRRQINEPVKDIPLKVDKIENVSEQMDLASTDNQVDTETNNIVESENNLAHEAEIQTQSSNQMEIEKTYCLDSTVVVAFNRVNRILHKYNLDKCVTLYKKLSGNTIKCKEVLEQDIEDSVAKNENKGSEESKKKTISVADLSNEASSIYKNIKVEINTMKTICRSKKRLNEIFGFMEDFENKGQASTSITYRLLRRANMIIESVNRHQIIDDITKLMKMIHEEEDKEGYDVKIDKKSLIRLLHKLSKDNFIRIITLKLKANGKEKGMTFICDPNIDTNHTLIKSAIEQAKIKFCLMGPRTTIKHNTIRKEGLKAKQNNNAIKSEDKRLSKQPVTEVTSFQYDFKVAKRCGYVPKFMRMQAMHIFLFYLVYEHKGDQTLNKLEQIEALRTNGYEITDDVAKECSTIYTNEVNWKMFIPPLPEHSGWPKGWLLMCDVLLRLPLSLFLKVHFVNLVIPGLEDYFNHPIKKHYLVRDLPLSVRNILLFERKYIFSAHQSALRLCWIGLLQFGPQRLKEKDQVFLYVNRKAELLDTTTSASGYHKVEEMKYPVLNYYFDGMHAIEKYWYDMWNICMNTSLGGRLAVQGKEIVLEDLTKKISMIEAATARTAEEAPELDIGFVPGDRRGAAGIDSAFFSHLKRNWNWSLVKTCPLSRQAGEASTRTSYERDSYLSKIQAKPLRFSEFPGLRKVSGPLPPNANDRKKTSRQRSEENNANANAPKSKKYANMILPKSVRQKTIVRKVLPRKKAKPRPNRLKYDEVDYRALQRMSKLRVNWDSHEDKILILCKIVMMYLCPNPHRQVITFTSVRDVLRMHSSKSCNKTSRACQRRLLYMMKQPKCVNSVVLGVEEIKQNFFLSKRFNGIGDKIRRESNSIYEYEKRMSEVFNTLVQYVIKKYYDFSEIGPKEPFPVPQTPQEFNIFYKILHPPKPFSSRGFTQGIRSTNDIYSATINSVIYSSMCCGKDRRSWAYQLFRVYQQYPEILLRNAMLKIRDDQMLIVKKHSSCRVKKYSNCMPISSSQYQLSSSYAFKFHTKWPYSVFAESYDVFLKLLKSHSENYTESLSETTEKSCGIEISPISGGAIATIHDYVIQNQMAFDVGIPNQIIMVNSELQQSDEVYFNIAQRYQDVLASLDSLQLYKDPFLRQRTSLEDETQIPESERVDVESDDNIDTNHSEKVLDEDNDAFMDLRTEKNISSDGSQNQKTNSELVKTFTNFEDMNMDIEIDGDMDTDIDIDEEAYSNEEEEGNNVIKFQDGTKIVLNEDDIGDFASCPDENITTILKHNELSIAIGDVIDPRSDSKAVANEVSAGKTSNSGKMENMFSRKRQRNPRLDEATTDEPETKKAKEFHDIDSNDSKSKSNEKSANNVKEEIEINTETSTEVIPRLSEKGKNGNATFTNNEALERGNAENFYRRTSEIMKNVCSEHNNMNACFKIDEASDMQKRGTRLALLKMREELNGLTAADSHHAHDFFVVNMFKVYYSLTVSNASTELNSFRDIPAPKELIPLSLSAANDVLQSISKYAVLPKNEIPYSEYKLSLPDQVLLLNTDDMDKVYEFVRNKKEMGATIRELEDQFGQSLKKDLHRIVELLTEGRIFLRTGVTFTRYVHHHYTDPWIINSYKMYRLEREAHPPLPKGAACISALESSVIEDSEAVVEESTEGNCTSSVNDALLPKECFDEASSSNAQSDQNTTHDTSNTESTDKNACGNNDDKLLASKRKRQKRRSSFVEQNETSRTGKYLDFSNAEEIKVVVKPWIRIDGVLNRRVLDRMLGAVLTYCLTHPGILLTKVQSRFVPALQPFHTRELVEILIQLGCLEKKILKKPRVTLISKPIPIKPVTKNNEWNTEEDIFLEPAHGAMIKFGVFLSTKMYNIDFIT